MKIRDISHHDADGGSIDLSTYDGVLIKATEGVGYIDPNLDANATNARAIGKPFGLYHYLSFISEVQAQISAFMEQLEKYTGYRLRPALDVETDGQVNKRLPVDINDRVKAFVNAVPGIVLYANPDMLERLDVALIGHPDLWLAEYASSPRDVPGYNRIGWQYRCDPDESDFTTALAIDGQWPNTSTASFDASTDRGSQSAPTYPLAPNQYFGPEGGGNNSISGYHSHRDDLKRWQQQMADRGWQIGVDGLYGLRGATIPQGNTADVARKFQIEKGLNADALIGPATWGAAWTKPIT